LYGMFHKCDRDVCSTHSKLSSRKRTKLFEISTFVIDLKKEVGTVLSVIRFCE
jgi:hypothetical protein